MIKVGFVGAGRIATAHLNAIKELKYLFLPVAVADLIDENIAHIDSEFGPLPTYRNYNDMLDKEKLDLVVVAAPNGLHYSICRDVLEKGMHVLVEKPLALSYREAEELIKIADSKKTFLGVVLQKRLFPLYKHLKFAIDEGRFGKIFLIHLSLRWSRSKSYFDHSWRGTREMDGGLVFNQASHDIDILGYLFSLSEIFAYGGTFIHKIETEDNVVGVFKTDAGTIGNFEFTISLNHKNMGEIIEIFGENGRFIFGTGEYENLTTIPPFLDLSEKDLSFARQPTLSGKAHQLVYREVAKAVNGRYHSVINGKNTLSSILIEEGILASMRSNEKVFLKGVEK